MGRRVARACGGGRLACDHGGPSGSPPSPRREIAFLRLAGALAADRPEPSPPETGTGTKTETGAALIHWTVLMHRWRRLSFRRRLWASLGTHLNFIKQRGRISAELAG